MARTSREERKAWTILQEAGISGPPVAVEDLARRLGVCIRYAPLKTNVSGMLYRACDHVVVGINSADPPTRQRFSIAHEIGHLVLHEGEPVFVDRQIRTYHRDGRSALGELPREVEANALAAALLMPRPFIVRALSEMAESGEGTDRGGLVAGLARQFHVSHQAMEYRLTNLGVLSPG